MSTNELQALFANLRPKSRPSPAPSHSSNHTNAAGHQSSLGGLSPLPLSPAPPFNPPANETSNSQNSQASQPPLPVPSATAQSLLNLLNFGPSAPTSSNANFSSPSTRDGPATAEDYTARPIATKLATQEQAASAANLLAKFMTPSAEAQNDTPAQNGSGGSSSLSNGLDASQDALLKLLSKAHPGASVGANQTLAERPQSLVRDSDKYTSQFAPVLAPKASFSGTPDQEMKTPGQSQPLFTYTNPFEALHASRSASQTHTPRGKTPIPKPVGAEEPQRSVGTGDEHSEDTASRAATVKQIGKRKILTPRLPSSAKLSLSREASFEPAPSKHGEGKEDVAAVEEIVASAPVAIKEEHESDKIRNDSDTAKQEISPGAEKAVEQQADGGDEWEDVEGSPGKAEIRVVPVYNFPIRPFVSINLQLPEPSEVGVREEGGVMEISRLKKEFDQLDRSLAAATSKFITYALIKNGGMRIIRQEDGNDRQVFRNTGDRVFSVAVCTTSAVSEPSDEQAVLGTGISGSVYYATISKNGNDLFEKNELDSESLIFPPYPPADENTAGGVLKTRAKRSSRHPEFFAIGRGKAIHLVWPATALSPRYGIDGSNRRVNTDKFFQERALQIVTGKAGKDFTFSEDDTLIVSLDKTGRLRFWDIRKLTDESNASAARVAAITIDTPLLTLSTALPSEKSWPTSVTFVDKIRPYTKGSALRYVLVGLRQNHTLQLWDIALGKAVQELNFPHENETDGICSVCYHANSGIIVVAHPTRNSIFFIHLSAPRYTLPMTLSQAAYVQRIAAGDPELPKPESTACMSGIREMAFTNRGQLRSVELLQVYRTSEAQKALNEHEILFELYVVHSKGVTCLKITKEDLGWNANSKIIHGINAADEGYVSLKELRLGSVIEEGPREGSPVEEAPPPAKSSKKKTGKKASSPADRPDATQTEEQGSAIPVPSAPNLKDAPEKTADPVAPDILPSKETKKTKKKPSHVTEPLIAGKASPAIDSGIKSIATSEGANSGTKDVSVESTALLPALPPDVERTPAKPEAVTVGISGDWLDKELKKVEKVVSAEFHKELNALHQNIQSDRLVQDSTAIARQEALLRLVSSTLSNNVEKSMSRILSTEITQSMIPALTTATVEAVTGQVGSSIAMALQSVVPHEMRASLPAMIDAALQNPNVTRSISDGISSKVARQIDARLNSLLEKEIVPAFKVLATSTAENAASEVEHRLREQIQHLEIDRRKDMDRLEKLGEVLQATAATLQQMSDTQVAFQGQILKDRRQLALLEEASSVAGSRQVSTAHVSPPPHAVPQPVPVRQKTMEELELEEISYLMNDGRYEEASIKWLQSGQPAELFDNLFIQFTPEYLSTGISPLIAFSVAVTIGNSLSTNTAQRLEWISAAFHSVDLHDPEIAELAQHAPALLTSLIQKLERLYMTIAERNPSDPALQIMPAVSRRAKEMRASLHGQHDEY